MVRNRASAKKAGTAFAESAARYMHAMLTDRRIERRALHGNKDRGDLAGVTTIRGADVVVEAKDYNGTVHVKEWLDEAETERINASASYGVVVFKRRGIGYGTPEKHGVLMTLETLCYLLDGGEQWGPVIADKSPTVIAKTR